ncbi:MAG: HAD-IB family phosphatase [Nitrososphaera sp.]
MGDAKTQKDSGGLYRGLAAFDMDGTLLDGRLVLSLARQLGVEEKVRERMRAFGGKPGFEQTTAIASLFAGATTKDIENAVESIPLARNCEKTISALREMSYVVGIISDSYTIVAGYVASRLGIDFVAANILEIKQGRATGRVEMPLGWERIGCFCNISVCKRFHLEKFADQTRVGIDKTIAIGDTKSDICMIERAGVGIAFMPKDPEIAKATENIISDGDLYKVLSFLP